MFAAPQITALPTEADVFVSAPVHAFSTTDAYSGFVTDTCVQATGVPLDDSAFGGLIREAANSQGGVIYSDPGTLDHYRSGGSPTNLPVDGEGQGSTGGMDPCCVCGIINPDQSIRGCVALSKPCCCYSEIHTDLSIVCLCQGGEGCSK